MTHITLLGLGIMGSGIAHNILKAGYPLTVYNRTKEKAAPLIEAGVQWADSPALAVHNAEVVISMVGDDVASRATWLGPDGAFATMNPHAIAYLTSSMPEKTVTYNNGKIDVPSNPSALVTVTRDNVKQAIIDSGYYSATDFTGLP